MSVAPSTQEILVLPAREGAWFPYPELPVTIGFDSSNESEPSVVDELYDAAMAKLNDTFERAFGAFDASLDMHQARSLYPEFNAHQDQSPQACLPAEAGGASEHVPAADHRRGLLGRIAGMFAMRASSQNVEAQARPSVVKRAAVAMGRAVRAALFLPDITAQYPGFGQTVEAHPLSRPQPRHQLRAAKIGRVVIA